MPQDREEYGEVGYTNEDRKMLYQAVAKLEQILRELDKKADRTELAISREKVTELDHELTSFKNDTDRNFRDCRSDINRLQRIVWIAVGLAIALSKAIDLIPHLIQGVK